jgi:hypothetical protein
LKPRDPLGGITAQRTYFPAHALPRFRPFIGREQHCGPGTQSSGENGQRNESATITLWIGIELDVVKVISHLPAFPKINLRQD